MLLRIAIIKIRWRITQPPGRGNCHLQNLLCGWPAASHSPVNLGLRGLHSSISVAQIGAIVLMSALKTELRMRRLEKEDNLLTNYPDEVIGHKLN